MKGRTWCISFKDDAKKDGDVTVKWKVIGADGKPQEIPGVWEGYKTGMTAPQKAARFYGELTTKFKGLVKATQGRNSAGDIVVCFQLQDAAPYRDIAGVEVGDQTGQTFDVYDDDDGFGPYMETVRFRLAGTPLSPEGRVRLGVGRLAPRAEVSTHRGRRSLAIGDILQTLTNEFNRIYNPLNLTAFLRENEVVIPEVPCHEGVVGGTDDIGLEYWLSMADPELERFAPTFDKVEALSVQLFDVASRLGALDLGPELGMAAAIAPACGAVFGQVGQGTFAAQGMAVAAAHANAAARAAPHCPKACPAVLVVSDPAAACWQDPTNGLWTCFVADLFECQI